MEKQLSTVENFTCTIYNKACTLPSECLGNLRFQSNDFISSKHIHTDSLTPFRHNIFCSLVESSENIVSIIDSEDKVLYVNKPQGGYDSEKIKGVSIYDFVSESYHKVIKQSFHKVRNFLIPQKFENDFIQIDGTISFYETVVSPLFCSAQRVVALCLVAKDITQSIVMQHKLQEQHMLFQTILDHTLAGYFDWNISTDTVFLSETFKNMFGYANDELPNTVAAWHSLVDPEDLSTFISSLHDFLLHARHESYACELRFRHKNGSTIWVLCRAKALASSNLQKVDRIVGCHIDITHRKSVERELTLRSKDLENKNIALQEIICTVNTQKDSVRSATLKEIGDRINPIISILKHGKSETEFKLLTEIENIVEQSLATGDNNVQRSLNRSLSQKEKQISLLIQKGLSVKEIAQVTHTSTRTIDKHRENIRKKIGLQGTRRNLAQHLQSIQIT